LRIRCIIPPSRTLAHHLAFMPKRFDPDLLDRVACSAVVVVAKRRVRLRALDWRCASQAAIRRRFWPQRLGGANDSRMTPARHAFCADFPPPALSCGLQSNPHASATPARTRPPPPAPPGPPNPAGRAPLAAPCLRSPLLLQTAAGRHAAGSPDGQPAGGARPAAPAPVNRSKPRAVPGALRAPRRAAQLRSSGRVASAAPGRRVAETDFSAALRGLASSLTNA